MIATHKIETIRFDQDCIFLNIDGNELTIPLDKLSNRLKAATAIESDVQNFAFRLWHTLAFN